MKEKIFIRYIDYQDIFLDFVIFSITAILGIRFFLRVTDYPQLGFEEFHIAHMLWGGLLMMLAVISLLTFLSTSVRRAAAVIGGLGFGTFIDELGKFITQDNNYFYQPTFSYIYLIFIILYLFYYFIGTKKKITHKEYLINSLELLKDAIINDLDREEKKKAFYYLSRSDWKDPLTKQVYSLLLNINAIDPPKPGIVKRAKHTVQRFYLRCLKHPWFNQAMQVLFISLFLVNVYNSLLFSLGLTLLFFPQFSTFVPLNFSTLNLIHLSANTLAGIFIYYGVIKLKKSRLTAYLSFKNATIVTIFLVQVFAFYQNPVRAFIGLILQIAILHSLEYMISQEQKLESAKLSNSNVSHLELDKPLPTHT